ncbi:MAG: hypothetical protein AAF431_19620 [Pseudomonadota bacterium]
MGVLDQLECTAVHEAGHAVAAWQKRLDIRSITIEPKEGSLGHTQHEPFCFSSYRQIYNTWMLKRRIESAAFVSLAGPLAEEKFNPSGYQEELSAADFDKAIDCLKFLSSDSDVISRQLEVITVHVNGFLHQAHIWSSIRFLAQVLLEKGTLSGQEVRVAILDSYKDMASKCG